MITATAGEQTVFGATRYKCYLQVKIEDALGVYQDYSDRFSQDFQQRAEVSTEIDARIAQASIAVIRESSGNSFAPLVNSDIQVGRGVRIGVARIAATATPVAGDFHPIFDGSIDEWGHPSIDGETDDNRIDLVARDGLAELQDRWVEEETVYGTEAGRALESVMQDILNDWAPGVTLYVPAATGQLAGTYRQERTSVLSALQTLADRIGWVIEYRWDNGTGTWRVMLYEPDRTPASTDWTFGPDDYLAVTSLKVARYHIRNVVRVHFTNEDGEREEYIAEDAASITKYGRRVMIIEESDDSQINSAARAALMADPAVLDLAEPDADQEIRTPLFWPIQLGDFYGFLANFVHYDVDQEFGVTGYTHVIENGIGETTIRTRGRPAGSIRGWLKREHRRRPPREVERGLELQNFREISRTSTSITYGYTLGPDLHRSQIHDYREEQPYSEDKWPTEDRQPDFDTTERNVEYTVPIPEQGYVGYLEVRGLREDFSLGDKERVNIFPASIAGDYIAFAVATVNQSDGSVKIRGVTTDRANSVAYAFNVGPADTVTFPTVLQTEAQGVGADGGGLVTGFTSDFEVTLPAGTVPFGETIKGFLIAYINANGTGPDGTAQDHDTPVGFQGERFKITDPDQITDGIVIADKLTESSRDFNFPVEAFSAPDWDTVAWTAFTLIISPGTPFSIGSGSTGNMGSDAYRYIYFDPAASTTTLQVSTVLADATGERKILLGVAQRAAAVDQLAFFVTAVGGFGINETVIGPNSISTGKLQALSVTTPILAAGAATIAKISVAYIRGISSDFGVMRSGYITNTGNTAAIKLSGTTNDPDGIPALPANNFIDFTATGTDPFIKHAALSLLANGNATFSGIVAATSFTGASATFEGYVAVRNISAVTPAAELRQDRLKLGDGVNQLTIYATLPLLPQLNADTFFMMHGGLGIKFGGTEKAVSEGAADSGGTGFKLLRVPN